MPKSSESVDIQVVGAGIVGICTALSLLEKGLSVRVFERDEPGQGASMGNAGVISPWSFVPQTMPGVWKNVPGWVMQRDGPVSFHWSRLPRLLPWAARFFTNCTPKRFYEISSAMEILTAPSVDLYRRHLAGTGHENLLADSCYIHAFRNENAASLNALDYRIRMERGAEVERIGKSDLQRLEPELSDSFKAAIIIRGQARARSPGAIGKALADKAKTLGAEFCRQEVKAVSQAADGNWQVTTADGTHASAKLVISAGVWSAKLLAPLGLNFPLIAERGYHVEYAEPGIELRNSVMDVERKVVASSMEGGIRIAGTSEFAGIDAPADPERIESLARLAEAMLPGLDPSNRTGWMGRRPSFPDSLPVIGELPGKKGLIGAFGHCHYGLIMAPKTGQLVAELASVGSTNENLEAFAGSRF